MKLSQLQEARYFGQHPVIKKVEQIADDLESRKIDDEYGFEIDDPESIIDAMDQEYERIPDVDDVNDEYPTWEIRHFPAHGVSFGESSVEAVVYPNNTKPHLVVYIR